MSTFAERGASSSAINLMNSSTRFPVGVAMQKPRTGSDLSAGLSAAGRLNVPMNSRQNQFFIDVVRFDDTGCFAFSPRSHSAPASPAGVFWTIEQLFFCVISCVKSPLR